MAAGEADDEGGAETAQARFSALASGALAAGRSGSKWKPLQAFVAELLGVEPGDVGAAGTHDFKAEFTRLRGQAPASAAVLGLVFLGESADFDVAVERISEAIRTGSWRPGGPIAVCADLGGNYRVHSVIGEGASSLLRRLEAVAAEDATALELGQDDEPENSANPLGTSMNRVLALQPEYSFRNSEPMRERGLLVRGDIPDVLAGWVAEDGSKIGLALMFTVLPETILMFGFIGMFLL